jgi:putative ABC transport system permease protein
MLKNYFSIAWRNLKQHPLYAFINIFSLAIGLASCLVIYLFISDETLFDTLHSKRKSIYRINEVQNFTGTHTQNVALSMPGMGPHLQEDFPEVLSYTRYWSHGKQLLEHENTKLVIEKLVLVDSTFLDIFDFPLISGDRSTALDDPYTVVITEETAKKIFGSTADAMGKMLRISEKDFKITGILQDIPENSHLQPDVLVSLTTRTREDPKWNDQWGSNYVITYLLLPEQTDIKAFEAKLPDFMRKQMKDPDIDKYIHLFLQRLDQVHLASTDIEHDYNNYRKFNGEYLDIFRLIGVFILLIAGVNFMNLTTARASHRWKEIGVRKSVGAKKLQLFGQFIFESITLALTALAMAVLLDVILLPLLNTLIGRQLSFQFILDKPLHLVYVVTGTLILGLLTGIYPSFYMTSFNTTKVLKGGESKTEGKSIFRSSLIVVQFGLALAMIVSTLIVTQQLSFMKNKDIGFDKEQMMLLDMNKEVNEKFETIKTELLKSPHIVGVTASGQRIGNNFHQWGLKVKSDTGVYNLAPSNVNVEYDYLKVYGIKLKSGRSFSKDVKTDNGLAFIVNESMAKELNSKEILGTPIGHSWYPDDSLGSIIGVTEDFNFNSLHHKINTLCMVVHADWGYDELSVKLAAGHVQEGIAVVKEVWDRLITTYPFAYTFLDQHFETLYRTDQQMSSVVTIMACLAILISCMGLFGLAAITTSRKTKEIGIRKVLGATETQITVLLSRNFALLIILSFLLVSPITYWLLLKWLNGFAYRITINPFMFVLGGLLALLIALLTISYHTIRSARENPVKSLRHE